LTVTAPLNPETQVLRFDPEFELLLACCSPDTQRRLSELLSLPLNWGRLLDLAEHHRLIPALSGALVSQQGTPSQLRDRARNHAWRAMHLGAELIRVARQLQSHEISFLAHKGPALGQRLYGNSAMRQFGDIDILVRARDLNRAPAALAELGYEPRLRLSGFQERAYLRSGYECVFGLESERNLLELQWQIVPRFYSIPFNMDQLFDRSIETELDGMIVRTLGNEDLLLVLCAHAAKHDWAQLGMLRDITAVSQLELDWEWTLGEARKLGIHQILQISLLAARDLFQTNFAPALLRDQLVSDATELANRVVRNLQSTRDPETESISYFRVQLQIRERWRDRLQIVWRLVTTPSIAEWGSARLPDKLGFLYRVVRIGRLAKRFSKAVLSRIGINGRLRQPARARDNSIAPVAPIPHGGIRAAELLASNIEIRQEYRSAQ
jgi:hypothetical protein